MRPHSVYGWMLVLLATLAGGGRLASGAGTWRHVGTTNVDAGLAGVASGPVSRVWFAADGGKLYAQSDNGTFVTADFEHWEDAQPTVAPVQTVQSVPNPPEPFAPAWVAPGSPTTLFALGKAIYYSNDGGRLWSDVSGQDRTLGGAFRDLAISPLDPDVVVVANSCGVWRSVDAGQTWTSLNSGLANLGARRILATPSGTKGLRLALQGVQLGAGSNSEVAVEWVPGEREVWRVRADLALAQEAARRQSAASRLQVKVSAFAYAGELAYAGSSFGQLFSSSDLGRSWRQYATPLGGAVSALTLPLPAQPEIAFAAIGGSREQPGGRILRTLNAGTVWDDLTGNLPNEPVYGLAADMAAGALYAATASGLYLLNADLASPAPTLSWTSVGSQLPNGPLWDVRLDAGANRVYVLVAGEGIYAAIAPHRLRAPRAVSVADTQVHRAAPGSLITLLGVSAAMVRSGDRSIPLLNAEGSQSQLQIPFDSKGQSVPLTAIDGVGAQRQFTLPLQRVSPVIFVDEAGAPLILDAASGGFIDLGHPARAGSRIQILATGLGAVNPDWPTGQPAPLTNPPKVVASVRVLLDGQPLDGVQATLAPGYTGMYLIEATLPLPVNTGIGELTVEAGAQISNLVGIPVIN